MAEATVVDLDVREMIPRERHSTIFARFDALAPGETLRLINDHDPKPLYYQMMAEHPGTFAWEPEQQGPEVWVSYSQDGSGIVMRDGFPRFKE